ncbi:probable G-protein coupled receptor B0563.6 [Paramacrobiotus metropolitanus]|uniref:probable G-protein coupled receptor B0563.6 n=1 Tax=Paramacrobiotus metropolitanus TaxID=2943436 RepID=UPI00244578C4|nr:probable G-protein coupled receptor B0563.6 [Paramacrobiotus metropolitanus]XP_055346570.1 probable G-protein coupled receptor B0563.6 [Paramacrobiotus metropolitanus]
MYDNSTSTTITGASLPGAYNASAANGDHAVTWWEYAPGSNQHAKDSAVLLYVVCYPILLTVCTIGNILNLIVLIGYKKKCTTNCYMMAMAIADIVFSWSNLPKYNALTSQVLQRPYNVAVSRAVHPYVIFAKHWSMIYCDWVLIAFSLERLLAVLIPLRVKWLLRPRTARIIIVALFFLAVIFAMERFVLEYIRYTYNDFPPWIKRWNEIENIAGLTVVVGNFSSLFIIDTMIIIALRRHRSAVGHIRTQQSNRQHNSNMIVLTDVALYLIFTFPTFVLNCLIEATNVKMYSLTPQSRLIADRICVVLHQCGHSIGFYLYLIVSKQYRESFQQMCSHVACLGWARKHWSVATESAASWKYRMSGKVGGARYSHPAISQQSSVSEDFVKQKLRAGKALVRSPSTDVSLIDQVQCSEIPMTPVAHAADVQFKV